MADTLIQFAMGLIGKYPLTASVLMVVGILRAVFKPLFEVLHAYVLSTPNPTDDTILAKVEESPVLKLVVWFIDYLASVKLIK